VSFEAAYRSGVPPWDIGRPQPAVERLIEEMYFRGEVLDVGCGTGENAIALAAAGLAVLGVDAAPTAINRAIAKAEERGSSATFAVADALALERLGRRFDGALDCGLFHTFGDADRVRFERSLHAVLRPGARYALLCFSDREPDGHGPRRISRAEILATFAAGWTVDAIEETSFGARFPVGGAAAWLARLTRDGPPAT
jgi:SAM-dependent methyltransferase